MAHAVDCNSTHVGSIPARFSNLLKTEFVTPFLLRFDDLSPELYDDELVVCFLQTSGHWHFHAMRLVLEEQLRRTDYGIDSLVLSQN